MSKYSNKYRKRQTKKRAAPSLPRSCMTALLVIAALAAFVGFFTWNFTDFLSVLIIGSLIGVSIEVIVYVQRLVRHEERGELARTGEEERVSLEWAYWQRKKNRVFEKEALIEPLASHLLVIVLMSAGSLSLGFLLMTDIIPADVIYWRLSLFAVPVMTFIVVPVIVMANKLEGDFKESKIDFILLAGCRTRDIIDAKIKHALRVFSIKRLFIISFLTFFALAVTAAFLQRERLYAEGVLSLFLTAVCLGAGLTWFLHVTMAFSITIVSAAMLRLRSFTGAVSATFAAFCAVYGGCVGSGYIAGLIFAKMFSRDTAAVVTILVYIFVAPTALYLTHFPLSKLILTRAIKWFDRQHCGY